MAHVKHIDKLTIKDMMRDLASYAGLTEGLVQLPLPDRIKIGRKQYGIPGTMDEFSDKICYGQRLFLARAEDNDVGLIIRMMDGYYFPIVTNELWNEDKSLLFGNKILNCRVKELYPVAMHLITMVSEIAERELKLLHKEPSKVEKAAGIEKLNVFSELNALDFLRDAMQITVPEVLLTPYNECLVRFMNAKETRDYQERYFDLMQKDMTPNKSKFTK
jgi:hypothetical protein